MNIGGKILKINDQLTSSENQVGIKRNTCANTNITPTFIKVKE